METFPSTKISRSDGREKMFKLLDEYQKSNCSIKVFCFQNKIAPATFHYWKKKHNGSTVNQHTSSAFAPLHIKTPSATGLFAEVHGIKIYQWVSAAYLKELLV